MKIAIKLQEPSVIKACDAKAGHIYRYGSSYYLSVYSCSAISDRVREDYPNHSFFVNLGSQTNSQQEPNLAILDDNALLSPICEGKITSA